MTEKRTQVPEEKKVIPFEPVDKFDTSVRIEWIAVKHISVVWQHAQRPLDENRAKQIAEHFDPDKFGTLAVTLPNGAGIYHAVDGQHRAVAVRMIWGENEKVPCQVIGASDPKRAAQIFDSINSDRKNPKAIDIFRVRVTSEKPDEVAVNKIVKANGYNVGAVHRRMTETNCISCVAAMLSVYRAYGEKILDSTIKVITATWNKDATAFDANIVRAYGEFLGEFHTKVKYITLYAAMNKKYTPGSFLGAMRGLKEINAIPMAAAGKQLILQQYNKNIKSKKLKLTSKEDE